MLQFKYNNKFINFAKNSTLEFERNNPLYLVDDIFGEYTTPITLSYSEENAQQLGDLFFDLSVKRKKRFVGELWDNGNFYCQCTLIINASYNNNALLFKSNVSGYLLTGLSNFFVSIKDIRVNTLKLGGERTFNYTTSVGNDGSNGIVQHLQSSWNNTQDFMCAPVRNDFTEVQTLTLEWLNQIGSDGNLNIPLFAYLFPRVKYVLVQLFKEFGYELDVTDLNGTDWENLFLFSTTPIAINSVVWQEINLSGIFTNTATYTPPTTVTFNLAKCFDDTITCRELVVSLCSRYGWAVIPTSNSSNKLKLVALKNSLTGTVKDFTPYIAPDSNSEFDAELKITAFKNSYNGNDDYANSIDFDGYKIEPSVLRKQDLPTPLGNYDYSLIYVFAENAYYKIALDDTTNQRVWELHGYGIYNVEPLDNNQSIETNATPLPIAWVELYKVSAITYYGYIPICKQNISKPVGIRTLLYLGMQPSKTAAMANGPFNYPMLSSLCTSFDGTPILQWSNVYEHKHNTTEKGIINYWFAKWIKANSLVQEKEQKLYLPLHELLNFKWNDVVNIFNTPYFIKKLTEPKPYKGFVNATLQRILVNAADAAIDPSFTVYLQFVWENEIPAPDTYLFGNLIYTNNTKALGKIYAWKDAAKTIPANVTNLEVRLKQLYYNDDNGTITFPIPYTLIYKFSFSGHILNIGSINLIDETNPAIIDLQTSDTYRQRRGQAVPVVAGVFFVYNYEIQASANYVVLP